MQTTLADLEEIRQLCSISVARPISKQDMQVDVAPFIDTYEKRRFKRRRQESTTAAEDSQVVEKESDSLGLLAMLRAMAAAGGLKQQMAAMDVFKLQLRNRGGEAPPPSEGELEDAYMVLLHLHFHPAAVAVRRAVSRLLAELSQRSDDGAGLEVSSSSAFIEELIALAGRRHDAVEVLQQVEVLANFQPTRQALLASTHGVSTKSLLRLYVLPLLMRAAAVPRRQAGGDDDTTPSSRGEEARGGGDGTPPAPWREEEEEDASVLLRAGLEALRGLVSLLNTWQQAKGGLLEEEDVAVLSRPLQACCLSLLTHAASPNELRAQAALAMVLLLLDGLLREGPKEQAACFQRVLAKGPRAVVAEVEAEKEWGDESRVFLVKALLIAVPPAAIAHGEGASLLTGPSLSVILSACASPSPSLRLLSFGALEAWLGKVSECLAPGEEESAAESSSLLSSLRSQLPTVGRVVLWNWEHSNKKVSASIPSVFNGYISLLERMESDPRLSVAVAEGHGRRDLVRVLGRLSSSRRCKYEGLRLLLPRLGSAVVLTQCPGLIASLLDTISGSNGLAGATSRLLIRLVEKTSSEEQGNSNQAAKARHLWLQPMASGRGLLAPLQSGRTRVADYLLEALLRMDPQAAPALLAEIRAQPRPSPNGEEEEAADMSWDDRVMWALVAVGLVGRQLGLPVTEALAEADGAGMLTLAELRRGCLSGQDDLRLSSLLLLVSTAKSVKPLEAVELRLLLEVLPVTLKAPLSSQRHGLLRAVRQLTSRTVEALRVARRKDGRGSAGLGEAVDDGLASITRLLCQGLYPGANMSRDLASLESLQVVLSTCSSLSPPPRAGTAVQGEAGLVLCLFNLLLSTWDRTRLLAYDLLATFPSPLPGLQQPEEVAAAVRWAWALLASPRRRESEAGALLLRVLYRAYVRGLAWRFRLTALEELKGSAEAVVEEGRGVEEVEEAMVFFLSELGAVVKARLDTLAEALDRLRGGDDVTASATRRSIHGLVQALRFALEETALLGKRKGQGEEEAADRRFAAARALLEGLLGHVRRALQLALSVIGEAGEEDLIVAERTEDGAEAYVAHAGPVNTSDGLKKESAASKGGFLVDCRGHMYQEGDEEEAEDGEGEESGRERLVVGAWLMTREAGACLVTVIKAAPLAVGQGGEPVLTDRCIAEAGLTLLQALGRFKHMGGIQVTQQALQSLTHWLLTHASTRPDLARLPSQWLSALLDRLRCPSPRFILRRSAGLASGFLAIAGAEPKGSPSTLLPSLIRELIKSSAPQEASGEAAHWGIRVHALNVLRLVLVDRGLNKNVTQAFVTDVMAVALAGFRDAQWAVRNSSLMVFGALVTLIVGGSAKNDLGWEGASSVEAADFFSRHPDFFELVTSAFAQAASDSDRARTVAPALYPILTLLSRLWLSGQVALPDARSEAMMRDCRSHIVVCARQPNALIRSVSSRALASLTTADRAPALVLELVQQLPSTLAGDDVITDHTAVHGALLMANSLLQLRCLHEDDEEGPMPTSSAEEASGPMEPIHAQLVGPKAWLAGASMACPPVRQAALEALDFFRQHAATPAARAEATAAIAEATSDLLALITSTSHHRPSASASVLPESLPGLPRLLAWVVEHGVEEDEAAAGSWLAHPVPEVREAALKRFVHVIMARRRRSAAAGSSSLRGALSLLARATLATSHHGHGSTQAQGYLEAMCRLASTSRHDDDDDGQGGGWSDVLALWPLLDRTLATTGLVGPSAEAAPSSSLAHSLGIANGDLAALALELMGWCLRWSSGSATGLGQEAMARWCSLLGQASLPQQSPALRRASVRSVRASGVLARARKEEESAAAAVRAGFTLIRVMQDDDESIRSEARMDASAFVVACHTTGSSQDHDLASACAANELLHRLRGVGGAGATAAWAEETASLVGEGAEGLAEALTARHVSATSSSSCPCVRIFEAEPPNIHVEPAAVAVPAARHLLHRLAELGGIGDDPAAMAVARQRLRRAYESVQAGLVARALAETEWLGGLACDPEVFGRLTCASVAGLLLRAMADEGGAAAKTPPIDRLLTSPAASSAPLKPVVWALTSLRRVDDALAKAGRSEGGSSWSGTPSAVAARLVLEAIDWQAVDEFGPFMAPRFFTE